MEKFFIITLVAGLIAFSSSIPTQMVHALSAKLPVGSWTITVGKEQMLQLNRHLISSESVLQEPLVALTRVKQLQENILQILNSIY